MQKQGILPHLALLTVNVAYGLNFVIAKDVMPAYILPSGFILIRVIGATFLFWALHAFYKQEKIDRADFPRLVAGGLFGVAANQLLFFAGLNLSTPINASIIMTATPITVLLMGIIFLRERITVLKTIGVLTGAAGAVSLIVFSRGGGDFSSRTVLGNTFIMLNAFSYAVFLIISKPLMQKYQPLTVIKWVFLFGFCFVLPFGAGDLLQVEWTALPADIVAKVIFIILAVTFVTYLLNMYALKYVNSSVVSIYIYVQPVVASLHAIYAGKDQLTWLMVACCLAIFTGVMMVSRR
jgi:drug/metabolite transporter (DMT)-like permease